MTVRPLEVADAPRLCALLHAQSAGYLRFFSPFPFDEQNVASLLAQRLRDLWLAIEWRNQLVGFFMLRGWDEGFEVPSYGVMIDESFCGYGLAAFSLRTAKAIARLRGAKRLMLKVHPENLAAKKVFEKARFKFTGSDPENGNLIYHFDLPPQFAKS